MKMAQHNKDVSTSSDYRASCATSSTRGFSSILYTGYSLVTRMTMKMRMRIAQAHLRSTFGVTSQSTVCSLANSSSTSTPTLRRRLWS